MNDAVKSVHVSMHYASASPGGHCSGAPSIAMRGHVGALHQCPLGIFFLFSSIFILILTIWL